MMRQIQGVALILISAAAFGAMAIFARLAYAAGVDPISLLFLRFSIGAIIMIVVLIIRKVAVPRGRILGGLLLMGSVGYVGQSLSYFTALTLASAGLVALLLYLYPVLVTLLSIVVFKEPLTRAKVLALALAVTGTVLTIGPGGSGQPLGIALGLLAAVIYAVYIVAGSTLTRHVTAIAASTVIMAAAAVVFGALVLARGLHLPSTWGGWSAVIAIAVVSTIVALIAFFAGLERVGPTNAAMLSTLEPVTTVSLAAIVLGEAMQPLRLMGGVLILGAVLVIVRYGDRPQSEVGRTERRTA